MQKLIARQPILDSQAEIYGFELLFREDSRNWCDATNPELKTSSVMMDSFVLYGIEDPTGNHRRDSPPAIRSRRFCFGVRQAALGTVSVRRTSPLAGE